MLAERTVKFRSEICEIVQVFYGFAIMAVSSALCKMLEHKFARTRHKIVEYNKRWIPINFCNIVIY